VGLGQSTKGFENMKRWIVAGWVALASHAGAQPIADAQWTADLAAGRFAQVERAATARIKANPDDIDAHAALTRSALALNDGPKRDAALKLMEACVVRVPRSAICHYGVGSLLGAQAISKGVMKAAMSLGRIREALQTALELDTSMFAARSGLAQFYLTAPNVRGGSIRKAHELAETVAAAHPDQSNVIFAMAALDQGKLDEANDFLNAVKAGADPELNEEADELRARLAFEQLNKKDTAKAKLTFERFIAQSPQLARGHYGLGRVYSETGAWDQAVAAFTTSATLQGAAALPVDYRLGIALQAKGSRELARAAFVRFVAAGRGNPKHLEDAQKRLTALR
jgi:tetratricopeptide (TPR) repeat protein